MSDAPDPASRPKDSSQSTGRPASDGRVRYALRHDTQVVVTPAELEAMSPTEFTAFRREVTSVNLNIHRGTAEQPLLSCIFCNEPLVVSYQGNQHVKNNRTFKHRQGTRSGCVDERALSSRSLRALRWNGSLESEEHRSTKSALAKMLACDPEVSSVATEKVIRGVVLPREFRRPDVQCVWRGQRLVFEIQLSSTFITDIVGRDMFYEAEGIHIIWVFRNPNWSLSLAADEFRYNRGNLFELTNDAEGAAARSGKLCLLAWTGDPDQSWEAAPKLQHAIVELSDLTFPQAGRPYFRDGRVEKLERQRRQVQRLAHARTPGPAGQARLEQDPEHWSTKFLGELVRGRAEDPESLDEGRLPQWAKKAMELAPDPELRAIIVRAFGAYSTRLLQLCGVGLDAVITGRQDTSFSVFSNVTLGASSTKYTDGYLASLLAHHYPPAWTAVQQGKAAAFLEQSQAHVPRDAHGWRNVTDRAVVIAHLFPAIAPRLAGLPFVGDSGSVDASWHAIAANAKDQARAAIAEHSRRCPWADWEKVATELWEARRTAAAPPVAVLLVAIRHGTTAARVGRFARAIGRLR